MNSSDIYKIIGQVIRNKRIKTGLTLEALAEKIERDWSYLSQIERGKSIPSIETLVRISNALNIPIYKLFKSEDKQEKDKTDPYIEKIAYILRDKDEQYKKVITNLLSQSLKKRKK